MKALIIYSDEKLEKQIYSIQLSKEKRKFKIDLLKTFLLGSILGPRLFTSYGGGLKVAMQAEHFVCYAGDSFVVIEAGTFDETKLSKNTSLSLQDLVSL